MYALARRWTPCFGGFAAIAMCVAAGWLRVHWTGALAFSAAGRLARYLLVALHTEGAVTFLPLANQAVVPVCAGYPGRVADK